MKKESIRTRLRFDEEKFLQKGDTIVCTIRPILYVVSPSLDYEYSHATSKFYVMPNTVTRRSDVMAYELPMVTGVSRPKGGDKFNEKIGKRIALLKAQRCAYRKAKELLKTFIREEQDCINKNITALGNLDKFISSCSEDLKTCGYLRNIDI